MKKWDVLEHLLMMDWSGCSLKAHQSFQTFTSEADLKGLDFELIDEEFPKEIYELMAKLISMRNN